MTCRKGNILMNLRSLNFFLHETATSLLRNGLMTMAVVSTVTVSLIIVGSSLLILTNIKALAKTLADQVEVAVYLREGVGESDRTLLQVNFLHLEGVKEVKFVSKEAALRRLEKDLGENLKEIIGLNPLPDSFQVKVEKAEEIKRIAEQIEGFKEVEEVVLSQEVASNLVKVGGVVERGTLVSLVLLGLVSLFLIMNAVRLSVFERREEIKIMQLVGATDWFIRWPFILEGIFEGLVGAALSGVILFLSYGFIVSQLQGFLPFLTLVDDKVMLLNLAGVLLILGMFLGMVGSLVAVGRYLED